jgi:hypothetical protein
MVPNPSIVLETVHVFGKDLGLEGQWRLLNWCLEHGADEFMIGAIVCDGGSDAQLRPYDEMVKPHQLPRAVRRHLTGPPNQGLSYETDLWKLNRITLNALRVAFPRGPFDYFPEGDAWFEDLDVYRGGELLLGVITHEHEGVLRVTSSERADLGARGIPFRDSGEWVGY